jgi:hypothetical protein
LAGLFVEDLFFQNLKLIFTYGWKSFASAAYNVTPAGKKNIINLLI